MIDFIHSFLFGIYPYIALVFLFLGTLIRYDREQYSWQASSSQILSDKGLAIGNIFFHLGIIFIFMGHFVGLLTPHALYEHFITAEAKQMLAIIAGGIAGGFWLYRSFNPFIAPSWQPSYSCNIIIIGYINFIPIMVTNDAWIDYNTILIIAS